MKKFLQISYLFLLIANFFSLFASQQIISINSLKEAQSVLDAADENTVVFFDVDNTLTVPENSVFWSTSSSYTRIFYKMIEPLLMNDSKSAPYYRSIWKKKENPVLIETCSVDLIKSLQNRGVKVLACTSIQTRGEHLVSHYPEWRYEKLKIVDIDFSASNVPDVDLTNLFDLDNDGHVYYPVLYKGSLCVDTINKGLAIKELLNELSWNHLKIIFFDDLLENVEMVRDQMRKHNIFFVGYHYNGAENLVAVFDPAIVEFQMQYLVDHEEWLNEKEARNKMEQ